MEHAPAIFQGHICWKTFLRYGCNVPALVLESSYVSTIHHTDFRLQRLSNQPECKENFPTALYSKMFGDRSSTEEITSQ